MGRFLTDMVSMDLASIPEMAPSFSQQPIAFLDKQFCELTPTEKASAKRLGYKNSKCWDNRFGR